MKEFPEKWKIDLRKLTSSQGDIVSVYYSKNVSSSSTYDNICKNFQWIKSHNESNQCVEDNLIEKKNCSFSGNSDFFTEITFEEFKKHVLIFEEESMKTYSLKELVDNSKVVVFIENKKQWQKLKDTKLFKLCPYYGVYCYALFLGEYSSDSTPIHAGSYEIQYPGINIVQFNQINFTQVEEKKRIGWKLINQEYSKAALSIAKASRWNNKNAGDLDVNSLAEKSLREAGVLELWFDPVYKKEVPKIEIKGYVAEFLPEDEVKFGCQTYTKDFIVQLYNTLKTNDFTILYNGKTINPEINKLASHLQKC